MCGWTVGTNRGSCVECDLYEGSGMTLIFLIAAIVLLIVAGIIAWPAHALALLCFGVAALAASFLPFAEYTTRVRG